MNPAFDQIPFEGAVNCGRPGAYNCHPMIAAGHMAIKSPCATAAQHHHHTTASPSHLAASAKRQSQVPCSIVLSRSARRSQHG